MNIFVAKLGGTTTSESLEEYFSQYGEVTSSKVIMDRDTGASKRYGFVEMENDGDAREAIDQLDGTEFEGGRIVVKEAEVRPKRQGGFQRR